MGEVNIDLMERAKHINNIPYKISHKYKKIMQKKLKACCSWNHLAY
jgi:hypothetical protein